MTATKATGAHDADPADALEVQLAQLEDRLVVEYVDHGRHAETEVRAQFQRAVQHFVNARVRSFLPILIERAVKAGLTASS